MCVCVRGERKRAKEREAEVRDFRIEQKRKNNSGGGGEKGSDC